MLKHTFKALLLMVSGCALAGGLPTNTEVTPQNAEAYSIKLHSQVSSTSAQRAEFKHSCSMVKMKFQAPLWTTELGAQNPVCYFTCLRRAMIWQLLCNTAVRLGCLQVVRSRFPLSRSRPL